jgi:hypothetical protein
MDWWWTPSARNGNCDECGEPIARDERIAFLSAKHEHDRRVVCQLCADALGISAECRESKRMAKARQLEMSL